MVHALQEVWRILVTGGQLIDLRPVADRWMVEVVTVQGSWGAGRLQDLPTGLADDSAAFEALARVSQAGWFALEQVENFDVFFYWDTPEEMHAYISEQWGDSVVLPEEVIARAQAKWADSANGSRVRVRVKMHIARWYKPSEK